MFQPVCHCPEPVESTRVAGQAAAGCRDPNAFPSNNLISHWNVRALPSSFCLSQPLCTVMLPLCFTLCSGLLACYLSIKEINRSEVVLAVMFAILFPVDQCLTKPALCHAHAVVNSYFKALKIPCRIRELVPGFFQQNTLLWTHGRMHNQIKDEQGVHLQMKMSAGPMRKSLLPFLVISPQSWRRRAEGSLHGATGSVFPWMMNHFFTWIRHLVSILQSQRTTTSVYLEDQS